MIYRIIAATLLTAIAISLGEWTEYVYTSYAFAIIGSIMLLKEPKPHKIFEVTYKDRRNMQRTFEAMEIAAWLVRPAIILLDKYRPNATKSEIALIYQFMNTNMASVAGPERELIKYLHAVATVPMKPHKSIELYLKLSRSRFGKKRAQDFWETFINAAAHVIVRVNCPDRVLNWYLINAHYLGIPVTTALYALVVRYRVTYENRVGLALTYEDYPTETFMDTGTNLPVPEELKNNDAILRLRHEVESWRRTFSETQPETDEEQYNRIMKPILDAEEQIRDILMYS